MKARNWAGSTVTVDHDYLYSQFKYYFITTPKEKIFPEFAMRPMLSQVRERLKGDLVGVEIGVHVARNSYNIMQLLPIKKLYLIDPYGAYDQGGGPANPDTDTGFIEKIAHQTMKQFGSKIYWIKDFSENATDRVPDQVDFVYIDGNHDYDFVKRDIELFYPKVKSGGIIGGHDFDGGDWGVAKASLDFADENNLELHGSKIDWWLIKP